MPLVLFSRNRGVPDGPMAEAVREDWVQRGVGFLQSEAVQQTPWEQLEAFLREKGLRPAEIDEVRGRSTRRAPLRAR